MPITTGQKIPLQRPGLNPTCGPFLRVIPSLSPPFLSIHCHYRIKNNKKMND